MPSNFYTRNQEFASARAGRPFGLQFEEHNGDDCITLQIIGNGKGDINFRLFKAEAGDLTENSRPVAFALVDRVIPRGARGGEAFTTTVGELRNLQGAKGEGYGTLLMNTVVQLLHEIGLPGDTFRGYVQEPMDMGRHKERLAFYSKFFDISGDHIATTVEKTRQFIPSSPNEKAEFSASLPLQRFGSIDSGRTRSR
jgi:hypothetical protein